MVYCAIKGCKSSSNKHTKHKDNLTFHQIPLDAFTRQKWIRSFKYKNEWLPRSTRICSRHFAKECLYVTNKGLVKITKGAVPSLYLGPDLELEQNKENSDKLIQDSRMPPVYKQILKERNENTNFQDMSGPSISKQVSPFDQLCEVSNISVPTESSIGSFSELESILETPRKFQLKKELLKSKNLAKKRLFTIKRLQAQNRRLKKKNDNLRNIIKDLKNKRYISEDIEQLLTSTIQIDIINNIARKKKGILKKNIYTEELKKFALTLNFYSPSGYRYVRKTFENCLPSPRTLRMWYSNINGDPGFTSESFHALEQKIKTSSKKLLFSLVADEMGLRTQKLWNGQKLEGLVDVGAGTFIGSNECNSDLAKETYMFLLVCINEKWKLPLAYFLINGLNGQQKANLIVKCLQKCDEVGAEVVSITFDGCKSNLAAMRILGCQIDNPDNIKSSFPHPSSGQEVVVFLDACHMLKLIRNHLQSKQVFISHNGNPIKWEYIQNLYNLQEAEQLHLGNKLSKRHVNFQNYKMKVKLASQLFSESVATAMAFCKDDLNLRLFKNSEETIYFIYLLNYLFDILNSRSLKAFGLQQPIQEQGKQEVLEFLELTRQYLKTLYIENRQKMVIEKTQQKITIYTTKKTPIITTSFGTGILGFILCIDSFKILFNHLVIKRKVLKYLPCYKFSQDHIELFFGGIRAHGGFNDNPNVRQLKSIYKKMLTHLELLTSFSGNCIPLEDLTILKRKSSIKIINETAQRQRQNMYEADEEGIGDKKNIIDDEDYLSMSFNDIAISHCSQQIVCYIIGAVVRRLCKKLKCESCLSGLLATEHLPIHNLIAAKDKGALCYPSYDIIYYLRENIKKINVRRWRKNNTSKIYKD